MQIAQNKVINYISFNRNASENKIFYQCKYCKQMYEDHVVSRHERVCNENPDKENTPISRRRNRKSQAIFDIKSGDLDKKVVSNKNSKLGRKLLFPLITQYS